MAYADDKKLIAATRKAAKAFGVAAEWSAGKPVRVRNDFLLEMLLFFEVVAQFKGTGKYVLEFVAGTGRHKNAFPKAPADKAGRPRFIVKDFKGNPVCQVCAGTRVADKHGDQRGLDVSIQSPLASNSPVHTDLIAIMDAKYKSDSNVRLTHGEYAGFHHWVEVFDLRREASPRLLKGSMLEGNCLVTNGQPSTEATVGLRDGWVVEVSNFYPGLTLSRRP